MKKYLKTLSSLILIITTISSCSKKEDEVVPVKVVPVEIETTNLNYTAVSSNLTNPITVFLGTKTQSASITWNSATLKIANLIFTGKRNNILEEYKTSSSDFNITPNAIKLAGMLPKVGTYVEASSRMDFGTSFTTPPFQITGVYVDKAGDDWPVSFILNENLSLNFPLVDVNLKKNTEYNALILFHWDGLTKDLTTEDFPTGSKSGKETIIISATSNVALFQKMKANLVNIAKVASIN